MNIYALTLKISCRGYIKLGNKKQKKKKKQHCSVKLWSFSIKVIEGKSNAWARNVQSQLFPLGDTTFNFMCELICPNLEESCFICMKNYINNKRGQLKTWYWLKSQKVCPCDIWVHFVGATTSFFFIVLQTKKCSFTFIKHTRAVACTSSVADWVFFTTATSKQPLLHSVPHASALALGQTKSVLYCRKRLLAATCWVGEGEPLFMLHQVSIRSDFA